jgi:hypothetical protein
MLLYYCGYLCYEKITTLIQVLLADMIVFIGVAIFISISINILLMHGLSLLTLTGNSLCVNVEPVI